MAVVTGGASGIGEAVVRRLVDEGAKVVIADLAADRGRAVAEELGDAVIFRQANVASEPDVAAAVDSAVKAFDRLDIMFNNAAVVGVVGPIAALEMDAFDRAIGVGLRGAVAGMKHAARVMVPQHSGVIVSTASIAALRGYGPHSYTAAKAGVVGITRSVAAELWQHNIRVNAVLPGHTATRMTVQVGDRDDPAVGDGEQLRLRRSMKPDDIADAVLYLCSDEARFVTGEALVVDGGLTHAGQWREPAGPPREFGPSV